MALRPLAPASLSPRERALIALAADVCAQDLGPTYRRNVNAARKAAVAPQDLREMLLHLAIYASFPKVLCALVALNEIVGSDEACASLPTPAPLTNLFRQPEIRAALESIDPDFADLAMRMGGEVWGRGGLTQRERALLCLATHVLNGTIAPIPVHAAIALRAGATRHVLRETITLAASFAPWNGDDARDALEAFLATSEEEARASSSTAA